jgi:hypothetical protein
VFWVNVPVGVFFTLWAYRTLRETGKRGGGRIDWWGNITFAVGLSAILIAVTFGLQPYGGHTMGWTNPLVDGLAAGGLVLLAAFVAIENRVSAPMIQLALFRLRAFTFGNLAGLAISIGRGGMQFVLIIWLQGIWLPLHGYDYSDTPLWAGIFLLPLTAGFLAAGPVCGYLSDRLGSRGLATGGAVLFGASFLGLMLLPINFTYWIFAVLIALNGIASGMFASPNSSSIMGSVPAQLRGVASGMRAPPSRTPAPPSPSACSSPHDRRTGQQPPAHPHQRTATTGRTGPRRHPGRHPAPGLVPVRRPTGHQPDRAPAPTQRRPDPPERGAATDPDRTRVLPVPDRRPLPLRPGHRVRLRRHPRLPRRDRLPHTRHQPAANAPGPQEAATGDPLARPDSYTSG